MVGSDTEATVMLNVVPGMNTGITALNAGLSSINAQFQNVTDSINSAFGLVDATIVSTGVMVAQFGMGAADAFGQFEQGMKIVQAVSQQSGEAIGYLSQKANEFSVQYRTDIDSITDGLQTLGRAGLNSATEQTEVLEQGLQTAKLEGRDLNSVLEEIIQNTALLGGDIKSDQFGEQSEYLNNLLVGTSLSAPIDTHDISETLKYSGGMLAAAGGTIADENGNENAHGKELIEDYMGAVAAFAQKGVQGSIAGTALRAFFNKPATQDKSVVEALESIGMSPEDLWDNEETMKPVSEQIGMIQRQMDAMNVSKMDQMQLWSKIVGGKMGQQMMKLDSNDIREMTTDIQQSTDAESLANQTFNTYEQRMTKMKEQGAEAFREFGKHIATSLSPIIEALSKIFEFFSNPYASFLGFTVFIATMGHFFSALGRIATRVKGELSSVASLAKETNLARDRKGMPTLPVRVDEQKLKEKMPDAFRFNQAIDTETKKKQEYYDSVKKNMSDIKTQIDDIMTSSDQGMQNIDINIDDIQMNIDEAIADLKASIDSVTDEVEKVAQKTKKKSEEVTESIKQNINEIKAIMNTQPGSGQPIPFQPYTKESLGQLKVPELKDLLRDRGLKVGGKKAELIERLLPYLNEEQDSITQIFDGNKADIDRKVLNALKNDPYLSQRRNGVLTYIDEESIEQTLKQDKSSENLRTRNSITAASLGMFGGVLGPDDYAIIDKVNHMDTFFEGQDISDDIIQSKIAESQERMHAYALKEAKETLDILFYGSKEAAREAAEAQRAKLVSEAWDEEAINSGYFGGKTYDEYKRDKEFKKAQQYGFENDLVPVKGMVDEDGNQKFIKDTKHLAKTPLEEDLDAVKELESQGLSARDIFGGDIINGDWDKDAYVGLKRKVTNEDGTVSHRDPDGIREKWGDKVKKNIVGHEKLNKASGKLRGAFDKLGDTLAPGKSGLESVIGILGGPFSAAMIGVTAAMELYNYMFGQWQKKVQEHQQMISEAQDKVSEAEDAIKTEYSEKNPNATQDDIDKSVDDAYVQIAENGYKMSGLDENTQALYTATSELRRATDALKNEAMDANFGISGRMTRTSDDIGGILNELSGNTGTSMIMDTGKWSSFDKDYSSNVHAGSIIDNNGKAVLTGAQASEDYIYSKENAAIFAADVWVALDEGIDEFDPKDGRLKNYKGKDNFYGLDDFFGTDARHMQEVTKGIFKGTGTYGGSAYDTMASMVAKNFKSETDQHKLQMALKNYQKDFQKVGKQMRKFEKMNKGQSALSLFGKGVSSQKALKNLEVKDKDLYRYIRSLSIKTGLSEQKILMAAQLQQMEDLNQIMVNQLQPQVLGIATNAYQQLSAAISTDGKTGSAADGANSTAASAAAIASKLSVLVEQALDKEMVNDYIARGGDDPSIVNDDSGQVLKSKVVDAWNKDPSQRSSWENYLVNHYGRNFFTSEYLSGWELEHPNATPEERQKAMDNYWGKVSGYDNFQDAINATRTGANAYYTKGLLAAYDASDIGEGSGSPADTSGGSGGDDGDSGSDSNKGTKKERVDLVLCNKKEIPKLNVNLFKKAPQFTVLNKNFKLRDIKINTQDKPRAVLDSLKNAIIDTQKRMDPKIIQDEEAEYDPVAATDGNSTPSGSTTTKTD